MRLHQKVKSLEPATCTSKGCAFHVCIALTNAASVHMGSWKERKRFLERCLSFFLSYLRTASHLEVAIMAACMPTWCGMCRATEDMAHASPPRRASEAVTASSAVTASCHSLSPSSLYAKQFLICGLLSAFSEVPWGPQNKLVIQMCNPNLDARCH